LHKNDKVFLFGGASYLHQFVNKHDIEVYHERTEHPYVIKLRFGFAQKRYLNACKKLLGLFVISTSLKKFFVGIGVPEERITIVNMTVDPLRFEGVVKDSASEKYIAYCGTASNNKDGVNKLIEAFGIVAQRHKDVKLYIIGETPSAEDKSGNLQLVESLGIKEQVTFTGVVPASNMPKILTNASVLALARPDSLQAQNGFPTKLGEYLLTGNPVVVTGVGDIPLFLKDGESALIVEPGNSKEFADKLCWAIENAEEALNIGRCGQEVALSNFNASVETLKIINKIIY
jgi:glycosyltransferase involved in cell wall biosynthesis